MRCNTRVFENNPRVIFEICQGTPEDTSVFVNLVMSCTVYGTAQFKLDTRVYQIHVRFIDFFKYVSS